MNTWEGPLPGKARWLVTGNLEEMPHISDLDYHEGTTHSPSLLMCLSTCTLFPSNKHFTCSLHLYTISLWKFIFFKAKRPGPLSLVTVPGGLEARVQYSQPDFNLWPRNQNPASNCCRLRHVRSLWHSRFRTQKTGHFHHESHEAISWVILWLQRVWAMLR